MSSCCRGARTRGCTIAAPQFAGVRVVDTALDIADIAPDCDLFVGAGGTMTREMAVLGIPTVSVYQDELLDVDRYLLKVGAFVHEPSADCAPIADVSWTAAARKPADRALLDKGRQAYAMIKGAITDAERPFV